MEDIMSHITTAHVATVTQPTELPIQTTQPRTVPRPIEPEAQPARPRPVTRPSKCISSFPSLQGFPCIYSSVTDFVKSRGNSAHTSKRSC